MKKIIFSFFILHSSFFIHHSTAQVTFQRTYGGTSGDIGSSVQQTVDGGYIIAGQTASFGTGGGIYLIKTDIYGDTLWTRNYGGTNAEDCNSIQQTTDEGYIIAGWTESFGIGGSDVYLIKINITGDTLWTRTFGGTVLDHGNSVRQTIDNGFIIAGPTTSFGAGFNDVYLIRTNANGDTLWSKTFGGTDSDRGNSVQETADGGFIITGQTQSFGAGSSDIYLVRTDANGVILWTKSFGGASGDYGNSVRQTADGGYIIVGYTNSFGAGSCDMYLIRTNTTGDILWSRTYGGTGCETGLTFDICTDGGYIIAGETSSFGADWWDAYMIRIDSNGNLLWSRTYKFGDNIKNTFYDVKQTSDGGFIAVGETGSPFSSSRDVYVVKTDANGNSGCNDSIVNTITGSPNTIVGTPATIVGSGAIVGNTATITGSTATVDSVLCIDTISSIWEEVQSQEEKGWLGVYPNPFTGTATISVRLPETGKEALLTLYDITGRAVRTFLINNPYQTVEFHAADAGTGFYYLQLTAESRILATQKFVILK